MSEEPCSRCDDSGWHECNECDRGGPCGCEAGERFEIEDAKHEAQIAAKRYEVSDLNTWSREQLIAALTLVQQTEADQ